MRAAPENQIEPDGEEPPADQEQRSRAAVHYAAPLLPARTPAPGLSPGKSWTERMQAERQADQRWWGFVTTLPLTNRVLLCAGAVLLIGAVLRMIVPPAGEAIATAVRPYTAGGKQETCLENLQKVSAALSQYAMDNDGRFPLLEHNGSPKPRVTWVTQLQQHSNNSDLGSYSCPLKWIGSGDTTTISAYAYNPVLAAVKSNEVQNPAATLALADRAEQHDISLLPPYPGWPQVTSSLGNIDSRHNGTANVVFADGHAETWTGAAIQEPRIWGGPHLFVTAVKRLRQQHPSLNQTLDFKRADAQRIAQALNSHRSEARAGTDLVVSLWNQNVGEDRDATLEEWGWRLANLWQRNGDSAVEKSLNEEQSRRSQVELDLVQQGTWVAHQGELGFAVTYPQHWGTAVETDGRYQTTYFRSGSPHIRIAVERSDRTSFTTPKPVDWSSMDKEYRQRYAESYKLVQMGHGTIGGEEAGLWVFEIRPSDGPRIQRTYLGRAHEWNSFVITCTAPAADAAEWQPHFDHFVSSFEFRY